MKKTILFSVAALLLNVAQAQIPNAGFESWTTVGTYMEPNGWWTFNSTASLSGQVPVTRETDSKSGSYALKSKVITVLGENLPATLGLGQGAQLDGPRGMPFTQRIDSLTGWIKYNGAGGDSILLYVVLQIWDATIGDFSDVATGELILTGTQTSYTRFSIPMAYSRTGNPDTISIIMVAGKPVSETADIASWFQVDDIGVSGAVGVEEAFVSALTTIYPNPSSGLIRIGLPGQLSGAEIKLLDMYGRMVYSGSETTVDMSSFAKGQYFVQISNSDYSIVKKLVLE